MNRTFYKNFFLLMLPMALKELISSLVNLIDTVMVGKLGENAIAAVGIGNQVYFLYSVVLFGLSCGASVFSSQLWGKKDHKGMRRILSVNLILNVLLSLLFVFVATVFPKEVFRFFKADAAVLEIGVTYLQVVAIGYLATAITTAFDFSVCSSEKAALPFLVRTTGLVINILLNWVLIFGKLGFPAMGVLGAAVATIVARVTELVIMLSVIYGKKMIQAISWDSFFGIPKDVYKKFIKTAFPIILNEVLWSTGITVYTWIFARIDENAMVIITIVQNIERLLLVFFHGGGNAAGVFVGKAIGEEDYKGAYTCAKRTMILLQVVALGISVLFLFCRPLFLLPYQLSPEVYDQTMHLFLVLAATTNVKALTFLLLVGVFRNGGDTKTAARIDSGTLWFIGIPVVAFAGFVLKLPLLSCYWLMSVDEFSKAVFSLRHFFRKKWMKSVVKDFG